MSCMCMCIYIYILSITYCGYRTYIISYHQKNIMYGCIYIMYVYVYIAYACIMSDVYTVCHIYIYVCVCMHTYHMYIYIYIIPAISCPYSRAEHIPCQNSWEISGNCEDPFQVKFVFHTVCQVLLFFWHVRCRLHMFFPKEDPYFQQFLETSELIMLSFPKMD